MTLAIAETEVEPNETEALIELLYAALPGTSSQELAVKLSRQAGRRIKPKYVNMLMTTVRANPARYGYTIPHVKRGAAVAGDEGRFFAVPVDENGEVIVTPVNMEHVDRGLNSVVRHTTATLSHSAGALGLLVVRARTRTQRADLEDWRKDIEDLARRGKRLMREWGLDRNGTTG